MAFERDVANSSGDGMGSSSRPSFHVFPSFWDDDVRNNFLSHLLSALDRGFIPYYDDDEDSRCGDYITQSVKQAIQGSRIAVIIFSKNYASSPRCLDELGEIMVRWEQFKLVVMPVFYRVEPREVRNPKFSYAKALASHELKFGKDSNKLKRWRKALSHAGGLSGWYLNENEDEAAVIRNFVKNVNVILDPVDLHVAKYPVGIESRVEEIKNLLNMEPNKVLLVGLWGMTGIGKTTLAKATFNDVADQFDGSAYLPDVRKSLTNPSIDLAILQEKLLSEVLRPKDVTAGCIVKGIPRIRDALASYKVLLLLDDISSTEQLDALAGGLDWFGKGSRILITTRNRSLIAARNEHIVHKVEGLPHTLALELFSKHAFPQPPDDRPNIPKELVDSYLDYCAALPLALVVLGSSLVKREEKHWRDELALEKTPGKEKIIRELKVGFEELDHNSRKILLRIADFPNRTCKMEIENDLGLESSLGIKKLMDRSLINIVEDTNRGSSAKRVEVHPLIRIMSKCSGVLQQLPDPSPPHGTRALRRTGDK